MKLFSAKTILFVLNSIFINLTSGWFGILLVSPGLIGGVSFDKYLRLLIPNLGFGIVGLLICLTLTERSNNYE